MFDRRLNLSNQVSEEVRRYFGEKVFKTSIARNVRLSEAPSHGKPVLLYDALSIGTQNYMELATEILNRYQDGVEQEKQKEQAKDGIAGRDSSTNTAPSGSAYTEFNGESQSNPGRSEDG